MTHLRSWLLRRHSREIYLRKRRGLGTNLDVRSPSASCRYCRAQHRRDNPPSSNFLGSSGASAEMDRGGYGNPSSQLSEKETRRMATSLSATGRGRATVSSGINYINSVNFHKRAHSGGDSGGVGDGGLSSNVGASYRQARANEKRRLRLGRSEVHGFGVFTRGVVASGEMLLEYRGEVVRTSVADLREAFYEDSACFLFMVSASRPCALHRLRVNPPVSQAINEVRYRPDLFLAPSDAGALHAGSSGSPSVVAKLV